MTCGEKIKYLRKQMRLTQTELAYKVGLQFGTISKYEKDSISIPAENLSKIADVLNTSTDYLLGRIDTPNTINEPIAIAASAKDGIDLSEIDEEDKKTIINIYNMIKNKNKKD